MSVPHVIGRPKEYDPEKLAAAENDVAGSDARITRSSTFRRALVSDVTDQFKTSQFGSNPNQPL